VIVAGVMSGTSSDGIDVALVRITPSRSANAATLPRFALLGHHHAPYPKAVRRAVLAAMNASRASVADLSRLNFLLGELYAAAVIAAQKRFRVKAQLIGCHGQTLYHQGEPAQYFGRRIATTWQTGEGAVVAARTGVPVVSDFRPADMAAGGKGAPLVPFLDYLLYRHETIGRIVLNIGGIANLTAIPANASPAQIKAFDTGPGNMVIDAVTEKLYRCPCDRDGVIALSGKAREEVVAALLRLPFFRRKPPKTAGREQFGRDFAREFVGRFSPFAKRDVVATVTLLTARTIADALARHVLKPGTSYSELIASGGGTRNPTLMAMLANEVKPLGLSLRLSDEFGLPSEAKEAVAFALLAYQTWLRQPSNLPSATGAARPAILGKISYA
jgi:anhydro-N-acetylmuramic acid kinase